MDLNGPPSQQFIDDHPVGHIDPDVLADIDFLAYTGNQFDYSNIDNDHLVDVSRSSPALVNDNATPTGSPSIAKNTNKQLHSVVKHDMSSGDMRSQKSATLANGETIPTIGSSPVGPKTADPRGSRCAVGLKIEPMDFDATQDVACVSNTVRNQSSSSKIEKAITNGIKVSTGSGDFCSNPPRGVTSPSTARQQDILNRGTANDGNIADRHDAFLIGTDDPLCVTCVDAHDLHGTANPNSVEGVETFHKSIHRTNLDFKCPICEGLQKFEDIEEWAAHLDKHIHEGC